MVRWAPLRRDILDSIATELLHNYGRGRVLIAVDGPTASGKSTFSDDLAAAMRIHEHAAFRASMDDFVKPRALRYARGEFSAEGRYHDAYDYSLFRRVLVDPFRAGGSTGFVLAGFDEHRDAPRESKWTTGPADAFLIVDGSYLNRPELKGLWSASIWLDADPAIRDARLQERNGIDPGSERAARYRGAEELYAHESSPRTTATIIVDNDDPDHPRRRFADSC